MWNEIDLALRTWINLGDKLDNWGIPLETVGTIGMDKVFDGHASREILIADIMMRPVFNVANKRKITVALFWSTHHHFIFTANFKIGHSHLMLHSVTESSKPPKNPYFKKPTRYDDDDDDDDDDDNDEHGECAL
ncbi:hypothetical protein Tco_0817491 [Tanacetum coccineum]